MSVEYKVVVYGESILSSMVFGSAKANTSQLSRFLTKHAEGGWRLKTMERENRRTLLFSSREAFIFVFERERP